MSARGLLFTDLYQLTMSRAYLESDTARAEACFELFFRNCPFGGEFAVFSGLDRVRELVESIAPTNEELEYLRSLPNFAGASDEFFDSLRNFDLTDVTIYSLREGSLAFPRLPLLQVTGPLYKLQLLETALLNAINFSTLVSTYARRLYLVSNGKPIVEFGMRRAQGPNGADTASRASYLGGCSGTSNVSAGMRFQIPVVGTMAHSFVQSFSSLREQDFEWPKGNVKASLKNLIQEDQKETNMGELAAFLAYARCFPQASLFLIDTYDSLNSGLPNAIRVMRLLRDQGYQALGVRLDSGDLKHLSVEARKELDRAGFKNAKIFASNELSEELIDSLETQKGAVDAYGVGTKLATCWDQPALGGVYKLVELSGSPRTKLSDQTEKIIIPGRKKAYRLYGSQGILADLLCRFDEAAPQAGESLQIFHPFDRFKTTEVTPSRVEALLQPVFEKGQWRIPLELSKSRSWSLKQMSQLREDERRRTNPTPHKVSLSSALRAQMEEIILRERPRSKLT